MKLVIAQGNPGQTYAATRHNIGWMCVDAFAAKHAVSFSVKTKFFAEIAEINFDGEKVLLVKPTTFYNETGKAARALMDFYKLTSDDILVIHDDLALEFGKIRIRQQGSDAGNNGIKSISAHIGPSYTRLRVGILNELREKVPDADFVLAKFSPGEQQHVSKYIIPKVTECIEDFIADELDATSYSTVV